MRDVPQFENDAHDEQVHDHRCALSFGNLFRNLCVDKEEQVQHTKDRSTLQRRVRLCTCEDLRKIRDQPRRPIVERLLVKESVSRRSHHTTIAPAQTVRTTTRKRRLSVSEHSLRSVRHRLVARAEQAPSSDANSGIRPKRRLTLPDAPIAKKSRRSIQASQSRSGKRGAGELAGHNCKRHRHD